MKLELKNAVYQYRNKYRTVRAVNEVSCTFLPGTFYAITGPSGSGKSTLLSLLSGLKLPTQGEVLVDGTSTAQMDRNRLRRDHVATIYQDFNLFPLLTMEENAAYSLLLRGTPEAEALDTAREKLRSVGLKDDQFRQRPAMLSGGEQQRVAIARVLCADSEVLLADEPTGSVDVENRQNIVNILQQLAHEENRCVIVVTHDLSVAERADVTLRIQDGRIMTA